MSLKYRNASGVETPVAGLNGTSGELVPSVALKQSGAVSVPSLDVQAETSIHATFTTPMPDADYEVSTEESGGSWGRIISIVDKTASGFSMRFLNCSGSIMTASTVKWTAFKLITDESRALDEAAIAQNTSDIANKCLKYTQLTSSDNINNIIAPGNYGGYNGDGVGGTFPYSGNSQFAILVTQAREYVYQLLQAGEALYMRYTGVSSGVPTGWSTWVQFISNMLTSGSGTRNADYLDSNSSVTYEINGRVCIVKIAAVFGVNAAVGSVLFTGLPACATATVNSVICSRDSVKALNVDTSGGNLTLRTAALAGEQYYGEIVYFV